MLYRHRSVVAPNLTSLAVLAALILSGCAEQPWRTADGRIVTGRIDYQKEPVTGRTYHLYIPTRYTPDRRWPLVVTAQGTFPFDQAQAQRDRWVTVAEREGLIVCSPDMDSANGLLSIPADRTPPELERDEDATLRILREVSYRYNIDSEAVMITAYSGGGFAAQFIGLHHPDFFRCIVGRDANFSVNLVSPAFAERARHMHVYLYYGAINLLGFELMHQEAARWFESHRFANFVMSKLPGGHSSNEAEAARYFLDIIGRWPSVRIQAAAVSVRTPRLVRFRADVRDRDGPASAVRVSWDFGDGTTATGTQVDHAYARDGLFKVFVTAVDADGHKEYAQQWYTVR